MEAGICAMLEPWAREHGLDLDGEALLTTYAEHEARTAAKFPAVLYPHILARSFNALASELGVRLSQPEAARLAVSVPHWPAFPDSPRTIVALAERYQLLILSNVDRASFAASNLRLGVSFTAIITAEDVGSLAAQFRRTGPPRSSTEHRQPAIAARGPEPVP